MEKRQQRSNTINTGSAKHTNIHHPSQPARNQTKSTPFLHFEACQYRYYTIQDRKP